MNLIVLRGFLVDGKRDAAVAMFKNGIKIYLSAGPRYQSAGGARRHAVPAVEIAVMDPAI